MVVVDASPGSGAGSPSSAHAHANVAVDELSADQVRAVLDAAGGQSHDQTWAEVSRNLARDKRPLSAARMRETIDTHTGRLGIANAPATSMAEVIEDLEAKSEAWHALNDWERTLWRDFSEEYGDSSYPGDLASADQLALTPDTRLAMALRIAPRYMKEGAGDAARELFNDPVFATSIVVGISAYLALWLAPEPIFTKATAVLTTVGLVASAGFVSSEIVALARAWDRLERDTRHAQSLGAIERAARRFGESVGGSGVRLLVALATVVGAKVARTGGAGGPAIGSTNAPVVVGQRGGAAVAAVPVAGGVSIKVTADGAVVLVNGSMSAYAVAHGPGGGAGKGGGATKPGARPAYKPFTKKNFRHNLAQRTGGIPDKGQAHHALPVKFEKECRKAGINIHDPKFGAWWKRGDHQCMARAYNKKWKRFFDRNENPTREEILQQGREMAREYGLAIGF